MKVILVILFLGIGLNSYAYTNNEIADSIYIAEGGAKTTHPYGILAHYKHTTARQACLNTIKHCRQLFAKQKIEDDFICFLGNIYCPTKGFYLTNDEKRLNINWVKNVKFFLNKEKSSGQKYQR